MWEVFFYYHTCLHTNDSSVYMITHKQLHFTGKYRIIYVRYKTYSIQGNKKLIHGERERRLLCYVKQCVCDEYLKVRFIFFLVHIVSKIEST